MGALQVKDQVSAGLFSLIWRLRGKGLRCVGFLGYRLIIDCQKAILGPDSLLLYRYTLNPNTHTHTPSLPGMLSGEERQAKVNEEQAEHGGKLSMEQ